MTRYVTPVDLDSCKIVVVNELTNERKEKYSPQPPKEALQNDGDAQLGKLWIDLQQFRSPLEEFLEPVACVIQHTDTELIVRWHVVDGDILHLPSLWQAVLQEVEEWTHG